MDLSIADLYRPDDAPTDAEILAAIEYDPTGATEEEAEAATRPARWKPTSARSANWTMERYSEKLAGIAAKEAEAAAMLARLDEERAKIEEWLAAETKRLRSGARHMEHLLTQWALELREQNPDQATFKLPGGGEVRTTARPMAVTKVDSKAAAERAVAWARKRELALNVKTTTTVDLNVMKPKVAVVDHLVLVHDPELGDKGTSAAWVHRPGLVAQWSQHTTGDGDGDESGDWIVTDPANGEVVPNAIVREGLFVVDAESGEHLDFLTVTPDDITVKVVPA